MRVRDGGQVRLTAYRFPQIGDQELLVYARCHNDAHEPIYYAAPEGARWPLCPMCGAQMRPPAVEPPDWDKRHAYVGQFMLERHALATLLEEAGEIERAAKMRAWTPPGIREATARGIERIGFRLYKVADGFRRG